MLNQDLSKLSKHELLAFIEAQSKMRASGLIVKRNSAGGVYIRHDSFIEYSKSKEKEYVAGLNIPATTAKALFGNPELLKQVVEQVATL